MCLAIPGKLETITGADPITRMGRVNFGGVVKEISLAYLPEVQAGEYVIVHAGFALSKVERMRRRRFSSICARWTNSPTWRRRPGEIPRRIPRR